MKIDTGKTEIEAEVADTALKRAFGLSFRKNGKMLMRKKLFLYFMNSDREVIHAEEAKPWYKMPRKLLHRPDGKYRYVLESFEELDIEEGDRLGF
jgi:uncharacterized membrane protein (UPF0127 family)